MMASRFTKVFQLIALVLAVAVLNVYVMAGPIRSGGEPGTTAASSTVQPTADIKVAIPTASSESQLLTPEAAAEKISLRFGSKSLSSVFAKRDVEARIATGNSFLKANTSAAATFMAKTTRTSAIQDTGSSGDDDDNGSRSTWIAVGIIAAVLTITVIGLRLDRNRDQ